MSLWHIFLLLWLTLQGWAQPATLPFTDCASGEIPSQQINISTIYGQILEDGTFGRHLNLTLIGQSGEEIIPVSTETGLLGECCVRRGFIAAARVSHAHGFLFPLRQRHCSRLVQCSRLISGTIAHSFARRWSPRHHCQLWLQTTPIITAHWPLDHWHFRPRFRYTLPMNCLRSRRDCGWWTLLNQRLNSLV